MGNREGFLEERRLMVDPKWKRFTAWMRTGKANRQFHPREQHVQKPGSVGSSGQMVQLDTCSTEGVGREGGRSRPHHASKVRMSRSSPFGPFFCFQAIPVLIQPR